MTTVSAHGRILRLLKVTKKPLLGTFWTGSSLAGTKALVFVATIMLARALPSEEFGRFVVLSSLSVVLIPGLDAGFSSLVFRTASRHPDRRRLALLRFAARSRCVLWLAAFVLLTGGTLAAKGLTTGIEMALVVLAAIAQAHLNTATSDLQGRSRFANAAWVRTSSGLVSLAGAVIVFLVFRSSLAALASFAFARIVPAFTISVLAWNRGQVNHPEDIRWRRALPLALLAILQVAYVRSDVLVMALFKVSSDSVAAYGVVYRWVMAAQLIPSALAIVVFPSLARRTASSGRGYMLAIQVGVLMTSIFAALTAWQSHHVFWLFGNEYAVSALQALPLVMTLLPLSISLVAVHALVAQGQERSLITVGFIGFATNVGLNFALVPIAGIRGALIATLCGESAVAISSMMLVGRAGFPLLSRPMAWLAGAAVASTLVTIATASAEARQMAIMAASTACAVATFAWTLRGVLRFRQERIKEQPGTERAFEQAAAPSASSASTPPFEIG